MLALAVYLVEASVASAAVTPGCSSPQSFTGYGDLLGGEANTVSGSYSATFGESNHASAAAVPQATRR